MDYGIVAFIDILGFAEMVRKDSSSDKSVNLENILSVIKEIRNQHAAASVNLSVFSDTIILETALNGNNFIDLVKTAGSLQMQFIKSDILLRGGIAFGKHYADATVTFSHALVLAYELERRKAVFPRIILDKNLLDWFLHHKEISEESKNALKSNVLRDRDDQIFIDYLPKDELKNHFGRVKQMQNNLGTLPDGALEKIRWVVGFHNYHSKWSDQQDFIIPNPWEDFSALIEV